jgi:hypothetical protein
MPRLHMMTPRVAHTHAVTGYRSDVPDLSSLPGVLSMYADSLGETVLRNDFSCVALRPDGLDIKLACRASFAYWVLPEDSEWHKRGSSCSQVRDLWLRIIEANDDGDEVWLWVDGDEEWIRPNGSTYGVWAVGDASIFLDAQPP